MHNFLLKHNELFEIEDSWDGFSWVELGGIDGSLFSYVRRNKAGKELLVVINFSGLAYDNYTFKNDVLKGSYKVILDSDSHYYGGENKYIYSDIKATNHEINIPINKLSILILKRTR